MAKRMCEWQRVGCATGSTPRTCSRRSKHSWRRHIGGRLAGWLEAAHSYAYSGGGGTTRRVFGPLAVDGNIEGSVLSSQPTDRMRVRK